MDDLDSLGDNELIHSALRDDFALTASYGQEHPQTWVGVWADNEPTVRIVAAFTSDVGRHDATLRPRLRYPDRLVVQSRQHSLADLRRARTEIEENLGQRATQTGRPILTSIGEGAGVICVTLRADQEDVASELAERYGSAVELQVGNFTFPGQQHSYPQPSAPPTSAEPALAEPVFAGLDLSVEVNQVIKAGDDGGGQLILRNTGSARIGPFESGQPLVGSLLNSDLEIVGSYAGWIAGVGRTFDLAPGQSVAIPVLYGTASTRRHLGYTLPPGIYWLRVRLRFRPGRGGGTPAQILTAPLTQITIIPRTQPHLGASP